MTKDMAPILVWSYPDKMVDWDGLEIEDYDDVNKAVITFKVTPGMKGNALVALTVDGTTVGAGISGLRTTNRDRTYDPKRWRQAPMT